MLRHVRYVRPPPCPCAPSPFYFKRTQCIDRLVRGPTASYFEITLKALLDEPVRGSCGTQGWEIWTI
jgi:hypothetical protein